MFFVYHYFYFDETSMCTIHIHKYMIYANLIDELLRQNEFYGVLRTFVDDLGLIVTYMQSISSFPP